MDRRRVFVVVIDAFGVGALPDAAAYGDPPDCSTLGGIDRVVDRLTLPNLAQMGLGHLAPLRHVPAVAEPIGAYGRLAERSQGKDTTTGHWEMMGQLIETAFPTYPEGFPADLVQRFIETSGCGGVLGNKPASGTSILDELGAAHLETGFPILYTSADSVFQLAAHVERVPLETLYHWCETARLLLTPPHEVSRVIARPFTGTRGAFRRLGGDRRDYALRPPGPTVMDRVREAGGLVVAIGKIEDIFAGQGVTHSLHTQDNAHGLTVLADLVAQRVPLNQLACEGKPLCDYPLAERQLHFINLVETDMNYGHRRDAEGYARALEAIDQGLTPVLATLQPGDLLMITADHGCDPTAPGSDHTREYVPLLAVGPEVTPKNLGTRATFADVGATVLQWLGLPSDGVPGTPIEMSHIVDSRR